MMWLYMSFGLLALIRGSCGSLADEMAETTQLCCNQGIRYGRNHSSADCSSAVPPDVPSTFSKICIFAMDECCREYFLKKQDCERGIEIAMNTKSCLNTKNATKKCCDQCFRGAAVGSTKGSDVCTMTIQGNSAEALLSGDAFMQCCKNAADDADKRKDHIAPAGHSEKVPKKPLENSNKPYSKCEEFAPNELCAHHCIPVPGSYKCECNAGFKLMADKRNCIEITKNRCKSHNPCQHKCNDNGVEVKCSCRRGYQLMADGKSCEDIDECLMNPPVCMLNTQCHNIQGSYKCMPNKNPKAMVEKGYCPPGFTRNLKNNACDDINECNLTNPPCPFYLCENTIGGYKCGDVNDDTNISVNMASPPVEDRCPPGFKSTANEECEDIDECAMKKDDCNELSQFCINTRGHYYCQDKVSRHCPPGFKNNLVTNKCEDINECDDGEAICRPDQICVNVPGEYDCKPKSSKPGHSNIGQCHDGMRKSPQTGVCEDINECDDGTHLCDQYQTCMNTNGSHECHCKSGFEQDPTTGACVDINECATDQNDCIPESQRCDNTVGSYLCIRFISCGTGYILHYSSSTCEDVDECALGTHNCGRAGPEYHCVNIPGSFRCQRKPIPLPVSSTTESDYEYYYSEEEIEENKTISQPNNNGEIVTTSTPKSVTTTNVTIAKSTVSSRRESEKNPDELPVLVPDDIDNNIINPYNKPEPAFPESDRLPDYPIPNLKQGMYPTQSINSIEVHEPTAPYYQQKPVTESTYSPLIEEKADATSPKSVYLDSGSVILETQDVPKKEWTKHYGKSICDTGFELGSFGECMDIDECLTNRHVCSEVSEVCQNTMGGYLCDCAAGFRRDLSTGLCTFAIPKSSTSISTSITTSTTSIPPSSIPNTPATMPLPTTFPTTSRNTPSPTPPPSSSPTPTTPPPTSPPPPTIPLTTPTPTTPPPTTPSPTTPPPTTPPTTPSPTLPPTTSPSTTPFTTSVPTTSSTVRNRIWDNSVYWKIPSRTFKPITSCDAGFHLNIKTGHCDDVNECLNGQASCASQEICINTNGGYRCDCPPNWRLSLTEQRCIPVTTNWGFPSGYENERPYPPLYNELYDHEKTDGRKIASPDVTQDRDTIAKCSWGYRLGPENTCEDIDECSTGAAKCGPLQLCSNLPGGYICSCPTGYRQIGDHICEDIDECTSLGGAPVCSQNAHCINTVGSYQCQCHAGFKSAPINDKVCVDIDECRNSRPGTLCQQLCNNDWGGYRCSCYRGYRLKPDNHTCSDINECTEDISKVLCNGRCFNEPGGYRCTCPTGYRLSIDKRSCIDIDECETGEASCAKGSQYGDTSEVCFNTRGGYRCQRILCPSGYYLEGKHRCTKMVRVCAPSDWDCAHQPTTISYNFITFVSNLAIPNAQPVKLFNMVGPKWPYAKINFKLKLIEVDAPPTVTKADFNVFSLQQINNQAVISLLRPLQGPQSIELEMSMELYNSDIFGGIAVARIYIYVSEYEF